MDVNEEYDPKLDKWTSKAPMPSKRGGIVGASLNETVLVFGGEGPLGTFSNNEQYFPANNTWKVRQSMPNARHGLATAVVRNQIFVIGGGRIPGLSVSDVNEVFTPRELRPITVPAPPQPPPIPIIIQPPVQLPIPEAPQQEPKLQQPPQQVGSEELAQNGLLI